MEHLPLIPLPARLPTVCAAFPLRPRGSQKHPMVPLEPSPLRQEIRLGHAQQAIGDRTLENESLIPKTDQEIRPVDTPNKPSETALLKMNR